MNQELQVNRQALATSRLVEREATPLAEGEARLQIDHFAFTANNITYGAAGDTLGYWQFFPTEEEGFGIIPVWGFADVVESHCPELPVGERVYGYFPPATTVVMRPEQVKTRSFVDAVAHRQALPPLYNRYQRVLADPDYSKAHDVPKMLLSPLHLTSYCIWDHLQQSDWFGAEQIVIVSASSKTSLGVAVALARGEDKRPAIGLTAAGNVEFVQQTGLYSEVIAYPNIEESLLPRKTVIVDMAGNPNVRRALQARLGSELCHYINVGLTHWDEKVQASEQDAELVPIASQEMFFAPSYILERQKSLAPGEFEKASGDYLRAAAEATFAWTKVETLGGIAELAQLYPRFVEGSLPPSSAYVVDVRSSSQAE